MITPDAEKLITIVGEILTEIDKGNDIEIRRAPDGGVKILVVKKTLIEKP